MVAAAAAFAAVRFMGVLALDPWTAPASAAQAEQVYALEAASKRVFLSPQDAQRGAELGLLPPGVRSILKVQETMHHGDFRWDDADVPAGKLAIRADVDRQLVSVFRGGHEIGTAVVLYGTTRKATPLGRFPIKAKYPDYHSRTYNAPMPYSLWLTDDGVAVHGSSVRNGRATHGCVGVPIEFARLLFDAAEVGDVVEIVSGRHRPR
jgi:lipoprotein-anchoring transpeptidase ErfK/SrfK